MVDEGREEIRGRLVLDDRVVVGRVRIRDGQIAAVDLEESVDASTAHPFLAPGFVDLHVHGWAGHDAMGTADALTEMSRGLARRGVTSFLPTAVSAPLEALAAFADRARGWLPHAPVDGAEPLGFNLEGPFLADSRRGAHAAAHLMAPADAAESLLEPLLDGLRLITIAPELPGAIDLIRRLCGRGVAVSIGHSAATFEEARAGYAAGGTSTTHLFNAMSGLDHRAPGVALAALLEDSAFVELIADEVHVVPAIWPLV